MCHFVCFRGVYVADIARHFNSMVCDGAVFLPSHKELTLTLSQSCKASINIAFLLSLVATARSAATAFHFWIWIQAIRSQQRNGRIAQKIEGSCEIVLVERQRSCAKKWSTI
mmetsp:Transcript_11642/g.34220  ORF Transcript_11642/g.34220 Transcript_11642/m.34220 type:complete len:112 (-) Transcript_11642:2848-3183(-)